MAIELVSGVRIGPKSLEAEAHRLGPNQAHHLPRFVPWTTIIDREDYLLSGDAGKCLLYHVVCNWINMNLLG